jgi:hypothetical protein
MNVPIEVWYAVGAAALTLLVSAAHKRGYRLPVLEMLLDAVHADPKSPAKEPAILQQIMDELRKRLPHPEDAKK